MKVMVTCPPMLGMKEQFIPLFEERGVEVYCPDVTQTLSEDELVSLLPEFDGWIIGDDPASRRVFEAGRAGKLKAAVKWGIGVDNVDFEACKEFSIPITNTPGMFGAEVADVALGYLLGASRETFYIDREIRAGGWPKNRGMSLVGKTVGVIGYGDIGKNTVCRAQAFGLKTIVYDPGVTQVDDNSRLATWPNSIEECDFLIFTCSLNSANKHMLDRDTIGRSKEGVIIVNVARGPLICEASLIEGLKSGKVRSAALDVFEIEPLPLDSYLREHPLCILGSHNSSNTTEAVSRTNEIAIEKLFQFLKV